MVMSVRLLALKALSARYCRPSGRVTDVPPTSKNAPLPMPTTA